MQLQAAPFAVPGYDAASLTSAFSAIQQHWPSSTHALRVAVFNAGYGVWKPFLQITDEEVAEALDTNVRAAFAFSKLAITAFKANDLDAVGKRGALIFTGATASWRGNKTTSAFAAGKFGLRALSQSLNKEFGRENIHVRLITNLRNLPLICSCVCCRLLMYALIYCLYLIEMTYIKHNKRPLLTAVSVIS